MSLWSEVGGGMALKIWPRPLYGPGNSLTQVHVNGVLAPRNPNSSLDPTAMNRSTAAFVPHDTKTPGSAGLSSYEYHTLSRSSAWTASQGRTLTGCGANPDPGPPSSIAAYDSNDPSRRTSATAAAGQLRSFEGATFQTCKSTLTTCIYNC